MLFDDSFHRGGYIFDAKYEGLNAKCNLYYIKLFLPITKDTASSEMGKWSWVVSG
jgi:hypothetical protein